MNADVMYNKESFQVRREAYIPIRNNQESTTTTTDPLCALPVVHSYASIRLIFVVIYRRPMNPSKATAASKSSC